MKFKDILTAFDTGDNLAKYLKDDELTEIAGLVVDDFERDKESRAEWEQKVESGMKLALQVYEVKNTPWPNAANVKLPLITVPCMQFSSRVYPALISGTDIVKMRVIGEDVTGQKTARARRVSQHLSFQVLEEDEEWESEMDSLLITLPLIGCAFKKTYFDPHKKHNCSKHVFAKDLVINYYARSLESASCITHVTTEFKNELEEKFRSGIYLETELHESNYTPQYLDMERSDREGLTQPKGEKPYEILEQHRYLDLDNDGYEEPYVVHVLRDEKKVLRIFPRFTKDDVEYTKGKISKINPIHYFTRYIFIPSPDGSIYGLGFFCLVGPINESANTLVNQLIDSGTLSIRGGGFIGRGARLKGGAMRFSIGEWKQINVSGDDLRKSFFPIPAPEPSAVLFNLLDMLVKFGERISSVTEMMVGETPGQNTPATTAMAALEQGEKVFTGIFKRVYRGLKEEFRKFYRLNQIYLNEAQYYAVLDSGEQEQIYRADYFGDPTDIKPTADPSVISNAQRLAKAEALAARAQMFYGYDSYQIERRYLQALQVEGMDEILPPPGSPNAPPRPTDPKIEIEKQKAQSKAAFDAEKLTLDRERLEIEIQQADADLLVKQTQAMLNLAKAEAEEAGQQIEMYKAQLDDLKSKRDFIRSLSESRQKANQQGSVQ